MVARRAATGRVCAAFAVLWVIAGGAVGRVHAANEVPPPAVAPAVTAPGPAPEPGTESTPTTPMRPEARAHYDRGLELYRARDFAAAIRALEQGFAIDPRREFLFAEAQALRLAGDCPRAIPLYQRFIDSGPQAVQAQAARLGIDRCAPERTPPAPPPPPPSALTPARPGATPPSTPTADRPPWWRDPWVLSAGGLGAAALGVGVAALVASNRSVDQAQSVRTGTYAEFDRLWAEAAQRRTIATVGLATGAGLVATGGLRAWWLSRQQDQRRDTHRLSFIAGASGATLLWEGRF